MAIGQGKSGDPITSINITPLVDVSLVLVIIFMVAAPLLTQPILPVQLPKAVTDEGKEGENITITITKDGQWALNADPTTPETLPSVLPALLAKNKDKYVIIRADADSPYSYTLEALKIAKAAGAKDYAVATVEKKRVSP
jgi:biopolymer transport protein ExbD